MKFISFLIGLFVCGAAMAGTITITYDDAKITQYIQDFLYIHPNSEKVVNPSWGGPEDGTSPEMVNKYTDKEWFAKKILNYIESTIRRGEEMRQRVELRKNLHNGTLGFSIK